MEKITISKETIDKHKDNIKRSINERNFKNSSDKIIEKISKENPELGQKIILPSLESEKSEDWKAGYLAGIATLYDLFEIEINKQKN